MADNLFIPRPPDVVTIIWEKNPLNRQTPRTIVEVSLIGSADQCVHVLEPGDRFRMARQCLLANGFVEVSTERFDVFGVSVFVRFS